MTTITSPAFVARVTELADQLDAPALDDPFLVMALLEDVYGSEEADAETDKRCVHDKVLVFNEFHETPHPAFFQRLGAFCAGLAISPIAHDDGDDDLPFETIDDLCAALSCALEGRAQVFAYGHDTYEMVVVREAPLGGILAKLAL